MELPVAFQHMRAGKTLPRGDRPRRDLSYNMGSRIETQSQEIHRCRNESRNLQIEEFEIVS